MPQLATQGVVRKGADENTEILMQKLAPMQVQMRSLTEAREFLFTATWGQCGVAKPVSQVKCWGEVRIRGSSDHAPAYKGCQNQARQGFLTCLIHAERELASRQLKSELDGTQMSEIACADGGEKQEAKRIWREEMLQRLAEVEKLLSE